MTRVILACDAVPNPLEKMAGLHTRVFEMYVALQSHDCKVAILTEPSFADPYQRDLHTISTRAQVLQFEPDYWICHPLLLRRFRWCLGIAPMAADCYEAPYGSFLYYAVDGARRGRGVALATYRRELADYIHALTMATWVLVANERQRSSLLTVLATVGLVDPMRSPTDRVLTVSSGVPDRARPRTRRVSRPGQPVFLWAGGAYPWFAIDEVVTACQEVAVRMPGSRFVFAGVHGANDSVGNRQGLGARLEKAVRESSSLWSRSDFLPWKSYVDRGQLYDQADYALCTYGYHIETYFSMRTRLLDYVWAGLPIITTGGDVLSAKLGRAGAALVVKDDGHALAESMIALATNAGDSNRLVASADALASGSLAWRTTVRPLLRIGRHAGVAQRPAVPGTAILNVTRSLLIRRRSLEVLAKGVQRLRTKLRSAQGDRG